MSLLRSGLASLPPVEAVLAWRARRRRFPGIAVLCYHGVRPDAVEARRLPFGPLHVPRALFDAHCRALAENCHPISLDDWRRHLATGAPLPARPVLVTFDDGYRTVVTEALPVLERRGVPAVVFVCTGPVERRQQFWYDALARTRSAADVETLKTRPHADWTRAIADLDRRVDEADPLCPMSVEDVGTLGRHELVEVGGHTVDHPILAHAAPDVQRAEIEMSMSAVTRWTGRAARAFAYPCGRPGLDFTSETEAIARACGIDHAFTTEPRFADPAGDPLAHPRFVMTDGVTAAHLLNRLGRVWQ